MTDIKAIKVFPPREETLRYLGYAGQEIEQSTLDILDRAETQVFDKMTPRVVCREFPVVETEKGIELTGASLVLRGNDIAHLLRNCQSCVVMAATLGTEIDRYITYAQQLSLTASLIADAAATAAIEGVCDDMEKQIRERAEARGSAITMRYSCGYGDLPLEAQPDILRVLEADKRIGLTCTREFIMLPRKSVSAIIGITEEQPAKITKKCSECSLSKGCTIRKAGKCCGA